MRIASKADRRRKGGEGSAGEVGGGFIDARGFSPGNLAFYGCWSKTLTVWTHF
jgi:hypothetical protein